MIGDEPSATAAARLCSAGLLLIAADDAVGMGGGHADSYRFKRLPTCCKASGNPRGRATGPPGRGEAALGEVWGRVRALYTWAKDGLRVLRDEVWISRHLAKACGLQKH